MSEATTLKRVLILDDDADFRRLLKVYLNKLLPGVDVAEYDPVARGAPGDDFDWSPYDALILDYYLCLHNVTGLDILQAHRKNRFFPATIMMTGAGNEEVAVRALRAGVYDYLRKEKFDKEELKQSLLSAVEKHQVERARVMELTSHNRAFNKALFYQELEQGDDSDTSVNRVLLLVELDDHGLLEERFGIIIRDNIVRHLARQCYEFFKVTSANPHITRLSDQSVALLINDPGTTASLTATMTGLCTHLQKNPYRFEEKKLRFTVSIGVVPVPKTGRSAEVLLRSARDCEKVAATREGNSFHILVAQPEPAPAPPEVEFIPEPIPEPAPEPEQAAAPAPSPEPTPGPVPEPTPEPIPEPVVEAVPAPPPAAAKPAASPPTARVKPAVPGPAPAPAAKAPAPVAKTPTPAPVTPARSATPGAAPAAGRVAPAAKPAPVAHPAAKPAPVPAPRPAARPALRDDLELDENKLDPQALKIKKAFNDNRVSQLFRPLVALTNEGQESEREIYRISLQLVDTDGKLAEEEAIYQAAAEPALRKFIDRWLLRETIGRVVNHKPDKYLFLLRLSEASLADPGLFNWLRKLLAGLDNRQPGKSIALELAAADFLELEKPAGALMTYLHKSHGFRFVFGQVNNAGDVGLAAGHGSQFDMVLMHNTMLKELNGRTNQPDQGALLQKLRSQHQRIVVDDIQDATSLTDAIALGADLAMGRFVGEPVQQLDELTSVETLEIV